MCRSADLEAARPWRFETPWGVESQRFSKPSVKEYTLIYNKELVYDLRIVPELRAFGSPG